MRDLYPASGSETDLAVTSCYVKNLGGADRKLSFFSKQTKQGLCPGNSFTVERTLINYGNNSQNFTLAYYLSDDLAITKNDILVQTKQTTLTAESTDSAEVSLTIPSIPSSKFGKWLYAGAIADPDQTLGENTTSNNRALLRSKIKMASLNDCMTLSAKSPKDGESQEQEKRFVAAYFDPTETVSRSTFVAIGMVTDIRYQQIMRAGPVYTWIHFRPEQILKEQNLQGRKGNTVVIRQYGGVDIERGYHYWMEGAPQLKTNQRYLAFLGKNQRHLNPYVGGQGGLWKIQTDPMRYDYEFVTSYFGDPIVGFKEGRFLLGSKRNEHPLTLIEVLSHLKKIIAAAPRQDLRYEVTKPIYFIKTVFPQTRG